MVSKGGVKSGEDPEQVKERGSVRLPGHRSPHAQTGSPGQLGPSGSTGGNCPDLRRDCIYFINCGLRSALHLTAKLVFYGGPQTFNQEKAYQSAGGSVALQRVNGAGCFQALGTLTSGGGLEPPRPSS
ncbi:protein phosphatase 1A-like protein [Lates japonicus]|uniref:Protein phosphatase 1A-like protein n=1 Tax=Lates japonicus TaxID=270547 RepID=A0AAD3N6L0_LATJO|nr:protein phosphatase 1A-like protein [Lates japonicus]